MRINYDFWVPVKCSYFFSADAFSNWCAATALSHTLLGNKELKEQLLRVQLATGIGKSSFR